MIIRNSPSEALEALALRIEYDRGQQIYKKNSAVEYWYRIESGVARRFSARADGRRQIVDLLLPGDFFGFGARGKHHFAVEAVLDRYGRRTLTRARAWSHSPSWIPALRERFATPPAKRCRAYML